MAQWDYTHTTKQSLLFSILSWSNISTIVQWEFQDPEMKVLYHIRPCFVGIFPYIGLKNRPYSLAASSVSCSSAASAASASGVVLAYGVGVDEELGCP